VTHPVPFDEKHRLQAARACRAFEGLDADGADPDGLQRQVDALVDLARHRFGVPLAFVSVQDEKRQIFLSRCGPLPEETLREDAVCAHAILGPGVMVVEDLSQDARFRNNPYVAGPPHLRFYAGAPVTLTGGFRIGTLCVCDTEVRARPDPEALQALETLAGLIAEKIEARTQPKLDDIRRQSQREFLALMSHELRTPLNAVIGFGEMIELVSQEAKTKEYAGLALASARHLLELIERILAFSHFESGEVVLEETVCDPAGLLTEAASAAVESNTGGTQLRLEIPDDLPALHCDPDHISAMLLSLINNAVDAAPTTVIVQACVSPDGDLSIVVADDGPGLCGADPARLLDPFSIGEDVLRREGEGIGLGLPLSQRIARLHGGDLMLSEGAPLCGLTASVMLPAARLQPAPLREAAYELAGERPDSRTRAAVAGGGHSGAERRRAAAAPAAHAVLK
jgi:signal transduction histidine kinase